MIHNILIAEPCELLRIGLRTIFYEDIHVSNIYEASTREGLSSQLRNCTLDLVIVNQSLITDMKALPQGRFFILANKADVATLRLGCKHGIRGYLSEKISMDLLRITFSSFVESDESLLIDPSLAPWIMNISLGGTLLPVREELLTSREREIVGLLREGFDKHTIARNLCIAETTLKTHIKNIRRKRDSERHTISSVGSDRQSTAPTKL